MNDDAAVRELQEMLDGCLYRDHRLRAAQMVDGRLGVALDARVEDSYHAGEQLTPTRAVPIAGHGERAVLRAAFRAIMRHERHEAAEFFLYQGTRPFDPHVDDDQ